MVILTRGSFIILPMLINKIIVTQILLMPKKCFKGHGEYQVVFSWHIFHIDYGSLIQMLPYWVFVFFLDKFNNEWIFLSQLVTKVNSIELCVSLPLCFSLPLERVLIIMDLRHISIILLEWHQWTTS